MTQITEEVEPRSRQRARRTTLNEKDILQKMALKTRTVSGKFQRDKVDGSVDLAFIPEDGRQTFFRLTAEQAAELQEWLSDTERYAIK